MGDSTSAAGRDPSQLATRIRAGDLRAATRLMRLLEDGDPSAQRALIELYPHSGRAAVIGLTGPPGAGKSTITDRLITGYRAQGKRVGVLAVDPTSPLTGGAILGDRVRMQRHTGDAGVFIRSLATRGQLGGLSRAVAGSVRVLDAYGSDVILIETVGVGQDEVDIAQLAHTTVVILVPGLGDDIQAIKAGLLEVADLFVVNKSDLPGADRVVNELRSMMSLKHAQMPMADHDLAHRHIGPHKPHVAPVSADWEPPILKISAMKDQGLDTLIEAVERHREFMAKDPASVARGAARARQQFVSLLRERMLEVGLHRLASSGLKLEALYEDFAEHRQDPFLILERLAEELRR